MATPTARLCLENVQSPVSARARSSVSHHDRPHSYVLQSQQHTSTHRGCAPHSPPAGDSSGYIIVTRQTRRALRVSDVLGARTVACPLRRVPALPPGQGSRHEQTNRTSTPHTQMVLAGNRTDKGWEGLLWRRFGGGPSEKVTPKWTAKGTTGMCRRKSWGEKEDESLQTAWEEDEGRQGGRGWERTQDRAAGF